MHTTCHESPWRMPIKLLCTHCKAPHEHNHVGLKKRISIVLVGGSICSGSAATDDLGSVQVPLRALESKVSSSSRVRVRKSQLWWLFFSGWKIFIVYKVATCALYVFVTTALYPHWCYNDLWVRYLHSSCFTHVFQGSIYLYYEPVAHIFMFFRVGSVWSSRSWLIYVLFSG